MTDIKGKVLLVTGGASGIGKAVALRFSQAGARIVLWDNNPDNLAKAVSEISATRAEVYGYAVDVTDHSSVVQAAAQVMREVGRVDILDNNAGVVFGGNFLDVPEENIRKMFAVNVNSCIWCTRAFLPGMISRGEGHIIMMSSAAGLLGVPGLATYCACKHAVIGLSESLRLELRKKRVHEVRLTLVCPSYVNTGMFAGVKPPFLTPWLEADKLADKIFHAVRKNRLHVREPFLVKLVPLLKALPWPQAVDWIGDILGMHRSMDKWRGRKEES